MTGILERRPSASRMPSGSETAMPTKERTSVTSRPPQSGVSTCGRPKRRRRSRKKETTGRTRNSRRALSALARQPSASAAAPAARRTGCRPGWPPALLDRIAAEHELLELGADEGPAGAGPAVRLDAALGDGGADRAVGAVQCALMNSQLMMLRQSQSQQCDARATVRTVSFGVANRFVRTQALCRACAGRRRFWRQTISVRTQGACRVLHVLSLHQRHLGVEPVHEQRGQHADARDRRPS